MYSELVAVYTVGFDIPKTSAKGVIIFNVE